MKPIDGPMVSTDRPRIVIIGAGFGGLWAARALAQAPADIVVIDRNNYHTFFPLLYQVGAAELEPEDIAYPVRNIFRKLPNVLFCLADVNQVDLAAKTIKAEAASFTMTISSWPWEVLRIFLTFLVRQSTRFP